MKLELEISGGIAPAITSERYTVEVESLPEQARKQVEELLRDLLAAPRPHSNEQLRDAMSYRLTVISDSQIENVEADDGGLSQSLA